MTHKYGLATRKKRGIYIIIYRKEGIMFYKVLSFVLLSFILLSCTNSLFDAPYQIIKVQVYRDTQLIDEYITEKHITINGHPVQIDEKIVLTKM